MSGRARFLINGCLVLFLAWRALWAATALTGEVAAGTPGNLTAALTLSQEERIHRWLRAHEKRSDLRPGSQTELYDVLRLHLAEDAVLNIIADRATVAAAIPHMAPLLFPVTLRLLPAIPAGWPAAAEDYDPKIHVLEYGGSMARDLDDVFELLAEGEGYKLWRCREAPLR